MQSFKRCICGKQAVVRVNNGAWLCDRRAMGAAIVSLANRVPVLMANKGIPKLVLVPKVVNKN